MTDLPLQNRIALITGASRGIGEAVAKAYAAAGAHVILIARSVNELERVDDAIRVAGGQATLVPMDLRHIDKIDQLALHITERFGRLDILVGNAGVLGDLRPVTHITDKLWNEVMLVNLTVNHRLIRAFDPLLKKSDAGRAIFTTSDTARTPYPYWGAYAISKAALEHMVKLYAAESATGTIRANLVDPGEVATKLREGAYPGQVDQPGIPRPDSVAHLFMELALPECTRNGEVVGA